MTTRQDEHRDDRREHEREEQLAVEARADLAQQRRGRSAARARASAREQRVADQHEHVAGRRQRRQLGQAHEVIEDARNRVAERVDELPIVGEVDVVGRVALAQHGPERLARAVDARERRVVERPGVLRRRIDRRQAPAVDGELDVAGRRPLERVAPPVGLNTSKYADCDRDEGQRPVVEDDVDDEHRRSGGRRRRRCAARAACCAPARRRRAAPRRRPPTRSRASVSVVCAARCIRGSSARSG